MKVLRIHITGWVASFRNPLFISGYQPTLSVPPISTVYGLISAAVGDRVTPDQVTVGYVFQSKGKAVDLETIYEFGGRLDAKPNIVKREFLVSPQLYIYTPNIQLKEAFEKPHYPLLLGRSTELATVKSIESTVLKKVTKTKYKGTLIPFPNHQLSGTLHALPTHFTQDQPRRPQGIRAFLAVTRENQQYEGESWVDSDMGWSIYFHGKE